MSKFLYLRRYIHFLNYIFFLCSVAGDEQDSDEEDVPVVMEDDPNYSPVNLGYSQRQFPFSLVRKKSSPERSGLHFSQNYNTPDDFRRGFESKDLIMHMPDNLQG